jgi:hypothetical protein
MGIMLDSVARLVTRTSQQLGQLQPRAVPAREAHCFPLIALDPALIWLQTGQALFGIAKTISAQSTADSGADSPIRLCYAAQRTEIGRFDSIRP